MNHVQPTKESLIKRRDEIYDQLEKTNQDLRIELEQNPEDQAIQVEQDEVAITMEANLRKELNIIEEHLADFND
jgi:RNA polymerase-binding transcription factor DksA